MSGNSWMRWLGQKWDWQWDFHDGFIAAAALMALGAGLTYLTKYLGIYGWVGWLACIAPPTALAWLILSKTPAA
jgi:hypothetical protein